MKLVSPQKVTCHDGATIQVSDRYSMEYVDSTSTWNVEVDFGLNSTGVYVSTLKLEKGCSAEESKLVLDKIIKAMNVMGMKTELFD